MRPQRSTKLGETFITPMGGIWHPAAVVTRPAEPVKRTTLKARVRGRIRSQKAKQIAKNFLLSLHKTCEEVQKKRGAASRG